MIHTMGHPPMMVGSQDNTSVSGKPGEALFGLHELDSAREFPEHIELGP